MSYRATRGFTLIELMIAIALSLIIMGVVAYGFSTTSRATSRGLELNRMHEQAAVVHDMIRRDLDSRVPGTGFTLLQNSYGKNELRFTIFGAVDGTTGEPERLVVAYEIPAIPVDVVPDTVTPQRLASNETFSVYRRSVKLAEVGYLDDTIRTNDNSVRLLHYAESERIWLPDGRGMAFCNLNRELVELEDRTPSGGSVLKPYTELMRDAANLEIQWIPRAAGGYTALLTRSGIPLSLEEHPTDASPLAVDVNTPAYLRIHLPFLRTTSGGAPITNDFSRVVNLDGAGNAFAWYFKL